MSKYCSTQILVIITIFKRVKTAHLVVGEQEMKMEVFKVSLMFTFLLSLTAATPMFKLFEQRKNEKRSGWHILTLAIYEI